MNSNMPELSNMQRSTLFQAFKTHLKGNMYFITSRKATADGLAKKGLLEYSRRMRGGEEAYTLTDEGKRVGQLLHGVPGMAGIGQAFKEQAENAQMEPWTNIFGDIGRALVAQRFIVDEGINPDHIKNLRVDLWAWRTQECLDVDIEFFADARVITRYNGGYQVSTTGTRVDPWEARMMGEALINAARVAASLQRYADAHPAQA